MGSVVPRDWQTQYERVTKERLDRFGGGNGGNGMWQQSVEARLQAIDTRLARLDDKIDRHFHLAWAGLIGAVLGLAGLMAKGFDWL